MYKIAPGSRSPDKKKTQNLHEKVLNHFCHPLLTYHNTHNLYIHAAIKDNSLFFGHYTSIFTSFFQCQ